MEQTKGGILLRISKHHMWQLFVAIIAGTAVIAGVVWQIFF